MNDLREPLRLTPLEQYVDQLLRFENRERYVAQSASTGANDPAPPPPRVMSEAQGREYARQETLDGRYASDDLHWSRA